MSTKKNKPSTITTRRYKRNLIITILVVLALIVGGGAAWVMLNQNTAKNTGKIITSTIDSITQPSEETVVEVVDNDNTVDKAAEFIKNYYTALSTSDSSALRELGATTAAAAIDNGWLTKLNYKIDLSKVENPTATKFPTSQGLYAGCTIYKISDFYTSSTSGAVSNNVSGSMDAVGWIYYDPINVKWVIADPSIPTGYAAPSTTNVERLSADKSASVSLTCDGVFSNSWWAWASFSVSASNKATSTGLKLSAAKFDNGFTVSLPSNLSTTLTASNSDSAATVSGNCTVYRGVTSNFGTEKIGASALQIDGNICPIVAEFGDEDISPIYAVGQTSAETIAEEEKKDDITKYKANTSVN